MKKVIVKFRKGGTTNSIECGYLEDEYVNIERVGCCDNYIRLFSSTTEIIIPMCNMISMEIEDVNTV